MKTFYLIRHKPTGNIMPLFPANRGYTNWDPETSGQACIPRLFHNEAAAKVSLSYWLKGVMSVSRGTDWQGEYYEDWGLEEKPNRKVADMEIFCVRLEIV